MYDAIYARQSVEKIDSISVESQIEFCLYETRGGEYRKYIDKGFSGKNTKRPAFEKMLLDIKKGIIRRVIVYKLDRISRSILDFSNMMEIFQRYNVQFVSSTEKFDTEAPIGRAMLNICVVFAQLERETIQKRVADAYYSRSKKGFYMGGRIPYGFSLESTVINGTKTSKYIPLKEEIDQIKIMYSIYSQPHKTLGDVLKYFNDHGLKHLRGKNWCTARISELLRNPIYVKADFKIYDFYKSQGLDIINDVKEFIGENACYLYKGETNNKSSLQNRYLVLAPHEGIINSDQWLECRIKSINNKQVATTHKAKNSWLVGKVKCGNCGYALVVRKSDRKRKTVVRYFVCSKKTSSSIRAGCKSIRAEDLENFILETLNEKLSRFKVLADRDISDTEVNELKRKILKIDKKIDDLLGKISNSNDTLTKYINHQIEKFDKQKRETNEKLLRSLHRGDESQISNYMSYWHKISLEDKILVVDSLIKTVNITEEKIEIIWKI